MPPFLKNIAGGDLGDRMNIGGGVGRLKLKFSQICAVVEHYSLMAVDWFSSRVGQNVPKILPLGY